MICTIPAVRNQLLYKINKKPADIPLTLPFIEWYIINNTTRLQVIILEEVMDMDSQELIKKLRKETGMTQKSFAGYFNIPLRTYEQWERGKRKMPGYLLRLMVYKLKTEQFVTGVADEMADRPAETTAGKDQERR